MTSVGVYAWYDHELYVWRWCGGHCGTNNDKNLLLFYPLFIDILPGAINTFYPMGYTFSHGKKKRMLYFIGKGIYPKWPIFVRPIQYAPEGSQTAHKKLQEGVRKEIERFLGGQIHDSTTWRWLVECWGRVAGVRAMRNIAQISDRNVTSRCVRWGNWRGRQLFLCKRKIHERGQI